MLCTVTTGVPVHLPVRPFALCWTMPWAAACGTAPDDVETDPAEPATASWMDDVYPAGDDAVAVGRVLIPTAHNSTSYACAAQHGLAPESPAFVIALWGDDDTGLGNDMRKRVVDWARTQDVDVATQLVDGIRGLQLRFIVRDSVLVTWHSVYGVGIDVILDDVVAFAVAHPSEVIVAAFETPADPASFPLVHAAFVAPRADGRSLCSLLHSGDTDGAEVTVAALRDAGRTVVPVLDPALRAYLAEQGDCPTASATLDSAWSITTTPEGVSARMAATVSSRVDGHLLQNDVVFSLDGAADPITQAGFVLDYPTLREAEVALGFSGDFAGQMIDAHDADGDMNLLSADLYEDTNLVEAAIAANRARHRPPSAP